MNLTTSPNLVNQEADWSPDDSEILFTRGLDESSLGLWVMNPDGSGLQMILPNAQWGKWKPASN